MSLSNFIDNSDTSGYGMFSKAGRMLTNRYSIFIKKHDILPNERKFPKKKLTKNTKDQQATESNEMDSTEKKSNDNDDNHGHDHDHDGDHIYNEIENKIEINKPLKRKNTAEPFSKIISREKVYSALGGEKSRTNSSLAYNPRFNLVETRTITLLDYNKQKALAKKDSQYSTITLSETESILRPMPDKPKKKIIGPIQFQVQTSRKDYKSQLNDPHEQRFSYIVSPENYSKIRRTPSVDISKLTSRNIGGGVYKNMENCPDYNPNFEYTKKKIALKVIGFDKTTSRKPLFQLHSNDNNDQENPGDKTGKPTNTQASIKTKLTSHGQKTSEHDETKPDLPQTSPETDLGLTFPFLLRPKSMMSLQKN